MITQFSIAGSLGNLNSWSFGLVPDFMFGIWHLPLPVALPGTKMIPANGRVRVESDGERACSLPGVANKSLETYAI